MPTQKEGWKKMTPYGLLQRGQITRYLEDLCHNYDLTQVGIN